MIVRNRLACLGWSFAVLYLLLLTTMTWLLLSKGVPAGNSPALITGVLVLFWIGGLGFAAYASSQPAVQVSTGDGGSMTVVWRYPFRSERRSIGRHEVHALAVTESCDDEGAPYYFARLTLRDGTQVDVSESHDRERCERVRDLLAAAVG